jgi:hypothetical protein
VHCISRCIYLHICHSLYYDILFFALSEEGASWFRTFKIHLGLFYYEKLNIKTPIMKTIDILQCILKAAGDRAKQQGTLLLSYTTAPVKFYDLLHEGIERVSLNESQTKTSSSARVTIKIMRISPREKSPDMENNIGRKSRNQSRQKYREHSLASILNSKFVAIALSVFNFRLQNINISLSYFYKISLYI